MRHAICHLHLTANHADMTFVALLVEGKPPSYPWPWKSGISAMRSAYRWREPPRRFCTNPPPPVFLRARCQQCQSMKPSAAAAATAALHRDRPFAPLAVTPGLPGVSCAFVCVYVSIYTRPTHSCIANKCARVGRYLGVHRYVSRKRKRLAFRQMRSD